jgi:hypothetical protein
MEPQDHPFGLYKEDGDESSHSLLDKFQAPRKRNYLFDILHNRHGHLLFIQITLITLYTAVFFLFVDRQGVARDLVYCKILVPYSRSDMTISNHANQLRLRKLSNMNASASTLP